MITLPTDGAPDPALLPGSESLVGVDGNAFAIMAETSAALRDAGASDAYVTAYRALAMSADYAWLLTCSMRVMDGEDPSS